jgi:hypothetical protein
MSAEIAAAISEYTKDMAALEKQIRDKDISKEDAERRRKELSDRLEARLEAIEEMAEAWADNLEESIENLEINLGDDLTGLWHPAGAQSATFGLYFTNQWRLSKTPLWLRSGWGFTSYTYDFGQNILQLDAPSGGGYALLPSNVDLRRSNLSMTYFEVPVSFVINPSRRGKGLNVSAGGFAGIRLGGTRQVVYRAEGMGRVTENTNGQFYGSLLSYGLQAELGFRRFTVGVRQNFNKPFNEAVLPANIQLDAQPNFYNASVYATVRFF